MNIDKIVSVLEVVSRVLFFAVGMLLFIRLLTHTQANFCII
jgi:hypothetical protein